MDSHIEHAKAELQRYTKHEQPNDWAHSHSKLVDRYETQANQVDGRHPSADAALEHSDKALEILSETHFPTLFGAMHSTKARLYIKRVAGNLAANLDLSLQHSKIALRVFESVGERWRIAEEHLSIGLVFLKRDLIGDDPLDNTDMGIRHILRAIGLFSKCTEPTQWAKSHLEVGCAYVKRISGSKLGNSKVAVKHLTKALEVFTKATYRNQWGLTHAETALVYHDWWLLVAKKNMSPAQIAIVQSGLVEKCIVHCEHALEVFSETHEPETWGKMKQTLIIAYGRRTVGDHNDKKGKIAKHTYELIDGIDTLGLDKLDLKTPEARATRHVGMAIEYQNRKVGSQADNLEKAVKHYTLALQICSPIFLPKQWAYAHMELSICFLDNKKTGVRSANEIEAIEHMHKTLEVYTENRFPDDWATTHLKLGRCYQLRTEGDLRHNQAQAVEHFNLIVESKIGEEECLDRWATAWFCLGASYCSGVEGMSVEGGREKGVECYTRFLNVSSEESQFWLGTHLNIAFALRERTKGDRVDNMHRSLEHFVASKAGLSLEDMMPELVSFAHGDSHIDNASKSALASVIAKLQVPLKHLNPVAWANNQLHLADKCLTHAGQEQRQENMEKAIGYCDSAMKVFTKAAFPEKWADAQIKLCAAYMQRVEGVRRDNMERAMRCFNGCKEVRPYQIIPDEFWKKQWARGADARKAVDRAAAREKE